MYGDIVSGKGAVQKISHDASIILEVHAWPVTVSYTGGCISYAVLVTIGLQDCFCGSFAFRITRTWFQWVEGSERFFRKRAVCAALPVNFPGRSVYDLTSRVVYSQFGDIESPLNVRF